MTHSADTPEMCAKAIVGSAASSKQTGYTKISDLANKRAFTLVEVVICLIIVLFAAMGAVAAITYTRLNMELEKQRLSALNYCRQAMEAIQSLDTAEPGTKPLVPFTNPDISPLDASLEINFHAIHPDGTIDSNTTAPELIVNRPVYARVAVKWTPYGSISREQEVSMATIVTRGID